MCVVATSWQWQFCKSVNVMHYRAERFPNSEGPLQPVVRHTRSKQQIDTQNTGIPARRMSFEWGSEVGNGFLSWPGKHLQVAFKTEGDFKGEVAQAVKNLSAKVLHVHYDHIHYTSLSTNTCLGLLISNWRE